MLVNAEAVDIVCDGEPLYGLVSAFDGIVILQSRNATSASGDPDSSEDSDASDHTPDPIDSTPRALGEVLALSAHIPIVRWHGELGEDGLTSDTIQEIPRLRMLEAQERVYFCLVGCEAQPDFFPSSNVGFSPIVINLFLEVGFQYPDPGSDSDTDPHDPDERMLPWSIPSIDDVLEPDSPPPSLDNGRPHLPSIFQGDDLDEADGPRVSLFDHFYVQDGGLAGWRVWVVGLELFFSRDDPSPAVTLNALIAEAQASWRQVRDTDGQPHIRYLTHAEYRVAVNDTHLHYLHTVRWVRS